jgi:Fe-Mn family superoxide dismutase
MAHNNHFFFSCLSPTEIPMPETLKKELENSFSSIESLKREMVVTASSMFGPGFVWLVKLSNAGNKNYSLLTTYLAGSPYPGAHARRQATDMNTEEDQKSISAHIRNVIKSPAVNTVGSHGQQSKKEVAPGGIAVTPVLCLNTWEHVYLPDYGVGDPNTGAGGKRTYAENWWRRIDWNSVYSNGQTKNKGFLI